MKQAWTRALHTTGRLETARAKAAAPGNTLVLTLHRIVPDDAMEKCRSPRGMVMRASLFCAMLKYMSEHVHWLTPEETAHNHDSGHKPRVLITFDDGWVDNYEVAAPLLAEFGIKAAFFVVTSYAGHAQPFWPERVLGLLRHLQQTHRDDLIRAFFSNFEKLNRSSPMPGSLQEEHCLQWLKQFSPGQILASISAFEQQFALCQEVTADPMERLMTWDQLRMLAHAGHTIASHTSTHALLTQLNTVQMKSEFTRSSSELETNLGSIKRPWIAYPNGNVNKAVQEQAFRSGYRFGFTTVPNIWRAREDLLAIPRINLWDGSVMSPEGIFDENCLDYTIFWRAARHLPH